MKRYFLLLLALINTALAQPVAPKDAFSTTFSFFRGLSSGSGSVESAYFISVILYFIIFLTIFMEGVKLIKFFGAGGEVSKQGKWFSIAAAALSTIALFFVDQRSGVSTTERLQSLVLPFGIWGGLVIAAVIAYITYRFMKDTEVFEEHIMIAMAIAAAVGITLAGFLLNINQMVGWGFLLLLASFIVGAVVAVFLHYDDGSEARASRASAQVEKEKERYKTADEQRKARREHERRERLAKLAKAKLLDSINAAKELEKKIGD
jgi:hypothetical protein